ncbi:MAG: hypothetical protein RR246_05550, partial [Clostridia bacterium]
QKGKKKSAYKWPLIVFCSSFLISAILSFASGEMIHSLPIWAAIILLTLFVALGIIFDIIGLAVATAEISPFNSMAARKLKSGKKAVWLISNAERVASFCNDVVGDIAGVVSGATGAAIAALLFTSYSADTAMLFTLMLTSFIAAVTVGGKALGKQVAIKKNGDIVLAVAKILCGFKK